MTYLRRILTAAGVTAASITLLVLAGTSPAQANGSGLGIVNSPHDFSSSTWNFRGEICRVCHVPHDHNRSQQLFLNGLLWNHQVSTATYTMYDAAWSTTLNNVQSPQPDGIAKLCLGCHDGSVAVNQFDNNADATNGDPLVFVQDIDAGFQIPGALNTGDLRGTHPLSIAYNGTDLGLNPDTDPMGTSGPISAVLDNGKVQCSSCHDVHDTTGEAVGNTHLLRVLNNGLDPSGLCLTCHNK
jgi:hypothetical protein